MRKRDKQKTRFFFQYQEHGKKHEAETKECKFPEGTKVWKTLKDNFNKGFIHSYGWELIED